MKEKILDFLEELPWEYGLSLILAVISLIGGLLIVICYNFNILPAPYPGNLGVILFFICGFPSLFLLIVTQDYRGHKYFKMVTAITVMAIVITYLFELAPLMGPA